MRTSRAFVTSLVLSALVPAAALSADGTLFGGGGKAPAVGQPDQFVAIDRQGKRADFYVSFELPSCGTNVIEVFSTDVRKGSFAVDDRYTTSFGNESHEGTVAINGRFDGDAAKGSARFQFTRTVDGQESECDSGKVRWTANAPKARGSSGKLKGGATYNGYTEQRSDFADLNLPTRLKVSKNKKTIARHSILVNLGCNDEQYDASGPFLARKVKIEGKKWDDGGTFIADRGEVQYEYFVRNKGRFGKRKVTGTWEMSAIVLRGGEEVSRCEAQPLRWQAAR